MNKSELKEIERLFWKFEGSQSKQDARDLKDFLNSIAKNIKLNDYPTVKYDTYNQINYNHSCKYGDERDDDEY